MNSRRNLALAQEILTTSVGRFTWVRAKGALCFRRPERIWTATHHYFMACSITAPASSPRMAPVRTRQPLKAATILVEDIVDTGDADYRRRFPSIADRDRCAPLP